MVQLLLFDRLRYELRALEGFQEHAVLVIERTIVYPVVKCLLTARGGGSIRVHLPHRKPVKKILAPHPPTRPLERLVCRTCRVRANSLFNSPLPPFRPPFDPLSTWLPIGPSRRLPCVMWLLCFVRHEPRQPRNVRLVIHPPISTAGKPMKELIAEARRAVGDGLEDWQRPKPDAADLSEPSPSPPSQ